MTTTQALDDLTTDAVDALAAEAARWRPES